ncbi:putative phage tail fiber protein [Clostridium botulinum]|uniref:methyl-accepting chemotaxis protein n=1 Tax=Clostridium botulinum TaxID=1491 RepID=UPI0005821E94|nr:methyl-accepting chemotaxis protein [Clostridium botulinum]BAQ14669.1 putative phage tail fiber protein [Clostridium botulinum]
MEKSGFFNAMKVGDTWDRIYKAENYAEYFASFIGNGVFPNPSTNLQVIGTDRMQVIVKPGKGWINGYKYENTDDLILPIDVADGVLHRIDKIVLRYDVVEREIRAKIKKGEFASEPKAPQLTRDADMYELGLADIKVNAGSISVTQVDITDLRLNKEVCGIVHGIVDQVDTTTIFNQYLEWYKNITGKTEEELQNIRKKLETDFKIWFDGIKGILSGDVAGNLLNLINKNKDSIDTVQDNIDKLEQSTTSRLVDITTKQGDLINLKTSNKTNLVSAVNELFQNANNGKNLISSVVGNPLLASDTFQQQSNKIQNLKNTFASNLTSKQQPSNGNESLNNLINKVANINTGKRFATGTRTIAETGTTQLVVQIRGLSFTPSKVIVTGHYLDVRGDDTAFYSIKSSTKDIYERYGRAVYGAHAEVFSHDSCGFDYSETKIVSNGFNIVISDRNTDITLKYWAFE